MRQESKKTLRIVIDDLPDLECSFDNATAPWSDTWIKARTQKRIIRAKRLDYQTELTSDGKNELTLHLTDFRYRVLPCIEDAGLFSVKPSNVSFADLVGLDIPRKSVQRVVNYMRNPEGVKPETGLLLCGPPGTGKTSFAKAIANELNMPFISVTGSDIVSWGIQWGQISL